MVAVNLLGFLPQVIALLDPVPHARLEFLCFLMVMDVGIGFVEFGLLPDFLHFLVD